MFNSALVNVRPLGHVCFSHTVLSRDNNIVYYMDPYNILGHSRNNYKDMFLSLSVRIHPYLKINVNYYKIVRVLTLLLFKKCRSL